VIADLESRGLLLYETKLYDLHPVVRGVVAESLRPEECNRFGQQVVDHFTSLKQSPYEQAETIEDLSGGLHLVRTLVKMNELQEACEIYRGSLSRALLINLEADSEILALLKPLFPPVGQPCQLPSANATRAIWRMMPLSRSKNST